MTPHNPIYDEPVTFTAEDEPTPLRADKITTASIAAEKVNATLLHIESPERPERPE